MATIEHSTIRQDEALPVQKRIESIIASIQEYGLKGSLLQGGSSIYRTDQKKEVRDQDTWFVQPSRDDLESFLREKSGADIEKAFGFDPGSLTPFTPEEVDYCIREGIEVVRLSGSIDGVKTTVKLVAREELEADTSIEAKRVLSKGKDKSLYERRAPDGSAVELRLENICLNPDEKSAQDRTYVIHDQNYYEFQDPDRPDAAPMMIAGLFTDFLVTAKKQYESEGMNIESLQREQRAQFGVLYTRDGEFDVRNALIRGHKFGDDYTKELGSKIDEAVKTLGESYKEFGPASETYPAVRELKRVFMSHDNLFGFHAEYFCERQERLREAEKAKEKEGQDKTPDEALSTGPVREDQTFLLLKPEAYDEGFADIIRRLADHIPLEITDEFEVRVDGDAVDVIWEKTGRKHGDDVVERLKEKFDGNRAYVLVFEGEEAIPICMSMKKAFRRVMGGDRIGPFLHSPDTYPESANELEQLQRCRFNGSST